MKPLVIYHADCTDGFGAAFAAWLKLGDTAEYLPMQYGDERTKPVVYADREVYILDFSFPRPVMEYIFTSARRVVWLDHHLSAIQMWTNEMGDVDLDKHDVILSDHKSGAWLSWEYFHPGTEVSMLIRHIDDRDRWRFQLEGSKELHAALASYKPWNFEQWKNILDLLEPICVEQMIDEGWAILRAQDAHVKSMLKQARKCVLTMPMPNGGWKTTDVMSYEGLALNTPSHMSEVGHELANQGGTYGLVWYLGSDNRVKCSLRSNGGYDVAAIARAFGGGGHLNAAGFETDIETLMGWLK